MGAFRVQRPGAQARPPLAAFADDGSEDEIAGSQALHAAAAAGRGPGASAATPAAAAAPPPPDASSDAAALKARGCAAAAAGDLGAAMHAFGQALLASPADATLHEMKSQVRTPFVRSAACLTLCLLGRERASGNTLFSAYPLARWTQCNPRFCSCSKV